MSEATPQAVVSKPTAKSTTSLSVFSFAIFMASKGPYTTRISAPWVLASAREPAEDGTLTISPKVAITVFSSKASLTANSISCPGHTHTGQPGPAMTSTLSGSKSLKPKRLITFSCVPHTCIILTGRFIGLSLILLTSPSTTVLSLYMDSVAILQDYSFVNTNAINVFILPPDYYIQGQGWTPRKIFYILQKSDTRFARNSDHSSTP